MSSFETGDALSTTVRSGSPPVADSYATACASWWVFFLSISVPSAGFVVPSCANSVAASSTTIVSSQQRNLMIIEGRSYRWPISRASARGVLLRGSHAFLFRTHHSPHVTGVVVFYSCSVSKAELPASY